jgi:transcriptional regulator with XRE-family HTH domain
MSSLAGIGSRLHQIRTDLGYSQSKVAAALLVSDRSYKNYEAGKTDLPLAAAITFCQTFSVNLGWLVFGEASLNREKANQIIEECVAEILSALESRKISIPSTDIQTQKIAKACAYLAMQCLEKGTSPKEEVGAVMELIL